MLKDGNNPIWKCQKLRERTKSLRTETVLQMFIRCTPSEELFWQTLRRQWLRKTSSQIATHAIQERGTKKVLKMSMRSLTCPL